MVTIISQRIVSYYYHTLFVAYLKHLPVFLGYISHYLTIVATLTFPDLLRWWISPSWLSALQNRLQFLRATSFLTLQFFSDPCLCWLVRGAQLMAKVRHVALVQALKSVTNAFSWLDTLNEFPAESFVLYFYHRKTLSRSTRHGAQERPSPLKVCFQWIITMQTYHRLKKTNKRKFVQY